MFEGFGNLFGKSSSSTETKLNAPFCLSINRKKFAEIKVFNLYKKILESCYSRSEGANDAAKIASLFDSAEKSGSPYGLISLIAQAMTKKQEVAIIYDSGVVRLATYDEKAKIKKDYVANASSSLGILLDFRQYDLTDLALEYMTMIFDILSSMNTQVGLAKALQVKISNLRATVSVNGKDEPINQAKAINESLNAGNSVLLDKNDEVAVLTLNSDSVKNAIALVNSQLATDFGVSISYVNGELTSGMSATGEADSNADEYGFQNFFNSIFKPACDKLYNWNLQFVSDDWRYFNAMISSLIAVENSGLLSIEQKQAFANRLMPIGKN